MGLVQADGPVVDRLTWPADTSDGRGLRLCRAPVMKGYARSNLGGSSKIGRLRTVGEGMRHRNRKGDAVGKRAGGEHLTGMHS